MSIKNGIVVAIIMLFTTFQTHSQSRIIVNIPSAKTEAEYIWGTIEDINFFEEHNYQVSLPKGDLIVRLKEKSKSGQLNDSDYKNLEVFIVDSIYNVADYQKGYDKLQNSSALINHMINSIDDTNFQWNYKEHESYQVNLTLYGPGGSYNLEEGSILIYTTPRGKFKNYEDPANTVIHEVVHIGIEESIISKYNVPHSLKERIVDTFVSLYFGQFLPEYKIQNMGDLRLDGFIKQVSDLNNLSKIVEQILNE